MVVTEGHTYLLNKPVVLSFAHLYLLRIAHQGCFGLLLWGICRAPSTSKIELFGILFNGFQSLTNVTKNYILDVMGVLDPSLLLRIKMLFQNVDTQCITNWKGNRRSSWKTLWIKRSPYDFLKRDPGVCDQNFFLKSVRIYFSLKTRIIWKPVNWFAFPLTSYDFIFYWKLFPKRL